MPILDDFLSDDIKNIPSNTNKTLAGQASKSYAGVKHCLPSHQRNAMDYLAGNTPGVMAFYAPEEQCYAELSMMQHPSPQPANLQANTRADNATVEDAETVNRLVDWRQEAIY